MSISTDEAARRLKRARKPRARAVDRLSEVRSLADASMAVTRDEATDDIRATGMGFMHTGPGKGLPDYEVADYSGVYLERMAPGCADALIARGDDIKLLEGHTGYPYGSTAANTIGVEATYKGLSFWAQLDGKSQRANDLVVRRSFSW